MTWKGEKQQEKNVFFRKKSVLFTKLLSGFTIAERMFITHSS